MEKIRVVHYINQFFAQKGGEESASLGIEVVEGPVGPGLGLTDAFAGEGEVVATIICGDNHIAERLDEVTAEILEIITKYKPDVFIAGPAFLAGRYGVACGSLCKAVTDKLKIPAITAMGDENPGVDIYRKHIYILKTGGNARTLRQDAINLANFAMRLVKNDWIGSPDEEGYYTRGWAKLMRAEKMPSERVVDLLLDKLAGRPYSSEIPLPVKEDVPLAAPVKDLSNAVIALATDGGLYPAGNPDNMPAANSTRFCTYSIEGRNELIAGEWTIRHNGYDNSFSLADPNRLVAVDGMRKLEEKGVIGKLHDEYLVTTGLITTVENATNIGKGMAEYIKEHGIDAVILTST